MTACLLASPAVRSRARPGRLAVLPLAAGERVDPPDAGRRQGSFAKARRRGGGEMITRREIARF
jgi:hypothetical protein